MTMTTTDQPRIWTSSQLDSPMNRGRCEQDARQGNVYARNALEVWKLDHPPEPPPELPEPPEPGTWRLRHLEASDFVRGQAVAAARAGDGSAQRALDRYERKLAAEPVEPRDRPAPGEWSIDDLDAGGMLAGQCRSAARAGDKSALAAVAELEQRQRDDHKRQNEDSTRRRYQEHLDGA